MTGNPLKPSIIATLAIGMVVVILAILPLIPAVRYWGADEIEKIGLDTQRKLKAYERSGNPTEMRVWLSDNNDGGFGMQVYLTLSQWSMTHKKEFVRLVESFDVKQQKQFIGIFAFTLDDSGQSDEFLCAYKGSNCKAITAITRRLGRSVPWSDYIADPSNYDKSGGAKKK
jgi:hypothetical protein